MTRQLLSATLLLCAFAGLYGIVRAGDADWGTVSGRITFGGATPAPMPLNLGANADKDTCQKNGPVLDESWIVNAKNKGLKNVFVWIEPADKKAKLPVHPSLKEPTAKKIDVDQPACAFVPHAIAMREGQILACKNSSTISHNFKWQGNPINNAGGNRLIPPGAGFDIDDLKADRLPVSIECNIHPWMKGWVRVFSHASYAVTDAEGNFKIEKAPVGEWRMKIWTGSGGWLGGAKGKDGQPVTIKAGENNVGEIVYPAP